MKMIAQARIDNYLNETILSINSSELGILSPAIGQKLTESGNLKGSLHTHARARTTHIPLKPYFKDIYCVINLISHSERC